MAIRAEYSSGDLARATGHTVRTIRFYEEQGLLQPTVVSEGGHRRYSEEDLERLRFIADLRELGIPLSEIRCVLGLRSACSSAGEFASRFQEMLLAHIEQAQRRLERLRRVKRELVEALAAIQKSAACEEAALAQALESGRIVKVVAKSRARQRATRDESEV